MKIKTADLIGPALRYSVAVCEGLNVGILTVDEQWERFIKDASSTELEKYADEYAEIRKGFKTELCKIHGDGYKSTLDARAWRFDEDWGVGGPIIENKGLAIRVFAEHGAPDGGPYWISERHPAVGHGPTPLIAAMRCFVASRLGDEVEVPDELV